jgi:PAS domain S-box-containing protein
MKVNSGNGKRILTLFGKEATPEIRLPARELNLEIYAIEKSDDLHNEAASVLALLCSADMLDEALEMASGRFPVIILDQADALNQLSLKDLEKAQDLCEWPVSASRFRLKLKQWQHQFANNAADLLGEAGLKSLAENMQSGFIFTNATGQILYINRAFAAHFPHLNEFDTNTTLLNLIYEIKSLFIAENDLLQYTDVKKDAEQAPSAESFYLHDGRIFELKHIPVRQANGAAGAIWQFKDISGNIADKKNLRHQEILLQSLVNSSPDPITFKDADGRWILANRAKLRLLGLEGIDYNNQTDEELMAKKPGNLTTMRMCSNCDRKAMAEKKTSRSDETILDIDGKKKIFDVLRQPIFDETGCLTGLVIIGRDVTERQIALEQLNRSTQWFEQLIESAPNFIVVVSQQLRVRVVNQVLVATLGLSDETIKNPNWYYDVFQRDERKRIYQKWLEVLAAPEKDNSIETRLKRFDGQLIDVRWNIRKLKDEDDENHYLFIGVDMTEQNRIKSDLMANEERYRRFFEQDITSDFLMDEDGSLIEANPAFYRLFHIDPDADIGNINFLHLIGDSDARSKFLKDLKKRRLEKYELTLSCYFGKEIINALGNFIVQEGNDGEEIRGYLIDITEQKRAEAEVLKTQQVYQKAIENARGIPYVFRYGQEKYDFMGEVAKELLELDPKTLTIAQMRELTKEIVVRSNEIIEFSDYRHQFKKGIIRQYNADFRMQTHSGRTKWVSDSAVAIIDEKTGKVIGAHGIMMDITDRKNEELRRQMIYRITEAVQSTRSINEFYHFIHKELNQVLDSPNFFIGIYDAQSDTISLPFMEDEKERFNKVPAGKTLSRVVIAKKKSMFLYEDEILKMAERGEVDLIGHPAKIWLGVPLALDTEVIGIIVVQSYDNHHAFNEADKELLEFVSKQIAISIRQKQAEEEIRKLSRSVHQSPVGIVITDMDGHIEYANPKIEAMTGYAMSELHGQNPRLFKSGVTPDSVYKELWETILDDRDWRGIFQNKHKNGSLYWVQLSISPVKNEAGAISHFVAVSEDISKQRELEQQLAQSQKMESIGQLAGGIAHDFNNILTAINGYAELSMMMLEMDNPVYEQVKAIKESGDRAGNLVRQLLAFSRKQVIDPQYININNLIMDLGKMLQRIIGEDIRIDYLFADKIATIEADPAQVEQIIINLVVNARDAINLKTDLASEKRISISTAQKYLDQSYVQSHAEAKTGDFIVISVTDSGIGMNEETRQRIFEPFFTTKDKGKGTGLGLATVYGIVHQNNGFIYVYSEIGKGTTFKIYWPVSEYLPNEKDDNEPAQSILKGTETILVVEDDPDVLQYTKISLVTLGYQVLEAHNGKEALAILREYHDRINLIFTDVIMPEMGGNELAEQVHTLYPNIRVLFASGYTDDRITEEALSKNFIAKPFTTYELSVKIREVIQQAE